MSDKKYIDLGQVTAYAYAKEHGYTGTEEEFGEEQAQFAQNAQQVAEDRVVVREDRVIVREDREHVDEVAEAFTGTTAPEAVQSVTTEGNTQVTRVQDEGDTQVARVQNEGNTQITGVQDEGDTQVARVQNEGDTKVSLIQEEGAAQVQAVEDKGDEVLGSIPENYEDKIDEVNDYLTNVIKVSDVQPESEVNKLWIKDQVGQEYTVPTYEEFESLSNDVTNALNAIGDCVTKDSLDNAGITNRSYITKYDGSVTTVSDSTYESPWCQLPNISDEFDCRTYRVTFDGVVYELRAGLFSKFYNGSSKGVEFIGNLSMYIDPTGCMCEVYDVPFCIIENRNDYSDGLLVFSETDGVHTLKLELESLTYDKLPPELIYGRSDPPILCKHNLGSDYYGISVGSGSNTLENTRNVIAVGVGNRISAINGHAYGVDNVVSGARAMAIGLKNTVAGKDDYAIGFNCSTSEEGSFAIGYQAQSSGGYGAIATGYATKASGVFAHAEGTNCVASGVGSHAEGSITTASGDSSHAQGWRTIANHAYQHVFGQANIADTSSATEKNRGNYVEIVGNGTSDNARSNARTLDWSGNESLAGGLTLGMGTADEVTISASQLKQLLALLT